MGNYYPDILEDLISKYGYRYGSTKNPSPFDGDIYIKGFRNVGEGYVKYIATTVADSPIEVLLYLEDYKQTYYCVVLDGYEGNYGRANEYFWD